MKTGKIKTFLQWNSMHYSRKFSNFIYKLVQHISDLSHTVSLICKHFCTSTMTFQFSSALPTCLLWWSQAISVTWFQKLCQSQRITIVIHPQGTYLWTMGSEGFRTIVVVFSVFCNEQWLQNCLFSSTNYYGTQITKGLICTIQMSLFWTVTTSVQGTISKTGGPFITWAVH